MTRGKPTLDDGVSDLDDLESKAKAATPGPWSVWSSNSHLRISSDATGRDGDVCSAVVATDGVPVLAIGRQDADYIAALNPTTALPRRRVPRAEEAEERSRSMAIPCSRCCRHGRIHRLSSCGA